MKKITTITTAGLLLLSFQMKSAEPGLEEGDSYVYHHVTFNEGNFTPSPNPENGVDWQFQFEEDTLPFQVRIMPAASHPDHDNFPSADLVIVNDFLSTYELGEIDGNFHFIKSLSNGHIRYGRVDTNEVDRHVNIFNDPEEVIQFPLAMGITFSDHWSGAYFDPNENAYVYWSNGFTTYEADQEGSMILNGRQLDNVIRVKRIRKYSEEASSGNFVQRYATYYEWYIDEFPFPVVTMILKKGFDGAQDIMEGYFIDASHLSGVGIAEVGFQQSSLRVYPNPGSGDFTVEFDLESHARVSASLCDLSGRIVQNLFSAELPGGNFKRNFSLDLPGGLYLLNLNLPNETRVERIIVQ